MHSAFFWNARGIAAGLGGPGFDQPVALVDLDQLGAGDLSASVVLPPCPVIGIGDAAHPLAARLDVVVPNRKAAALMVANVVAKPLAASVVVELLRLIPLLPLADGLVAESFAYGLLQGSAEHRQWLTARKPVLAQVPGRLELSRNGGGVMAVMDRPWAGNAIDRTMRDALEEVITLVALDDTISGIELRGRGRAFCLGADLAEFGTTADPATAHAIRRHTLPARLLARVADRLEVHVGGACVGAGVEMAGFARRITATKAAWFQLPELAMGLLPGAGGCVSLVRRIGRQRTAWMILSGKRISARQALDWGLVDSLVDEDATDESGGDVAG